MIKPASSLCNLRCKYCFYTDVSEHREICSYGIMTQETTDALLASLEAGMKDGDHLIITFQGGEPCLAGLDYFKYFTDQISRWNKEVRVDYALQTNGTLIDEAWCDFLLDKKFLVGISYDLLPQAHDLARVDAKGKGTYKAVTRTIQLLDRKKVDYNILCTLTNPIARHPQQVWKKICEADFRYVQFTPCMDDLDSSGKNPYALTPERFASFYIQLFQLWYRDYRAGRYRSIKFFDDVINLLAFGIPTACGIDGLCRPQLVVEADGSSYPCDFYCLDPYRLGNLAHDSLESLLASPRMTSFLERPRDQVDLCATCPYEVFCGGGCPRMQAFTSCSAQDQSCGYRTFLDACGEALLDIVKEQKALRRAP